MYGVGFFVFPQNKKKRQKRNRKLTDGEKDIGLAAVALTMGEEKVNETEAGVDMAFVSWVKQKRH